MLNSLTERADTQNRALKAFAFVSPLALPTNGTFELLHLVGGVSSLARYVGYMLISVCRIKPG